MRGLRILDTDGFGGVLGIVDADFDLLDAIPASSLNIIRGDCHDMEASQHDLWQVCNGHDLTAVLSIGLRRAIGSQPPAVVGVEEIGRALRLACEAVDFTVSALYRAMRAWEQRNRPFQVLS